MEDSSHINNQELLNALDRNAKHLYGNIAAPLFEKLTVEQDTTTRADLVLCTMETELNQEPEEVGYQHSCLQSLTIRNNTTIDNSTLYSILFDCMSR